MSIRNLATYEALNDLRDKVQLAYESAPWGEKGSPFYQQKRAYARLLKHLADAETDFVIDWTQD